MKVEQQGSYRTAVFERTITPQDLAEMVKRDVVGVELLGHRPDMDVQSSVDLLATGPPLKSFSATWVKTTPVLPGAMLGTVEQLDLVGRVGRTRLDTAALKSIRSLHVPAGLLRGPLSACEQLQYVGLNGFKDGDLSIVDGCMALKQVKINGRRTEVTFGWRTPPAALEELHLYSVFPTSLQGLQQLTALRVLDLWAPTPTPRPHILDLQIVAGCPRLDYLECRNVGTVVNARAIADRTWRSFRHD
jgi:hypothetical protein